MPTACTVCGDPAKAKGLCSAHYNKAYYTANAERLRQRTRDYFDRNPEVLKAQNARRDKATLARKAREYYWRDQLAAVVRFANYRARKLGIPGTLTVEAVRARFAYFGHRCWICHRPGTTIDHVKPTAKGGANWPSNIRPACGHCNYAKSWEGRR